MATPWAVVLTRSPSTMIASCPWARRNVLLTLAKASSSAREEAGKPGERRNDRGDEYGKHGESGSDGGGEDASVARPAGSGLGFRYGAPGFDRWPRALAKPRRHGRRAARRQPACFALDDQRLAGQRPLPDIGILTELTGEPGRPATLATRHAARAADFGGSERRGNCTFRTTQRHVTKLLRRPNGAYPRPGGLTARKL